MRLDKFICKSTELTKSEAIKIIKQGDIRVNGDVVMNEAVQVHENNTVLLNGVKLKARDFRYILMHKPAGTICSNVDEVYPSLFNYLDAYNVSELHIAGRLDADTTGMVLITDDGRWSFNITAPTRACGKVYRVTLSRPIADDVVVKFKSGIKLQGEQQLTRPAILKIIRSNEVLLTITEGKFHQVKRMFSAVGNRVVSLHREAIGDVSLDVDVGQWRYLTDCEVKSLAY
ncbi:pseudouridine synthase [Thaumasiovibrio sp. DFM-14]|uniref:pseudouridine synthase n=1 Tax=Thaumasiovibrio sp. DFM-14 TaxID=3384792 RepID=UPI00399FB450